MTGVLGVFLSNAAKHVTTEEEEEANGDEVERGDNGSSNWRTSQLEIGGQFSIWLWDRSSCFRPWGKLHIGPKSLILNQTPRKKIKSN